ncbi:ATP phosphoribosyltransferase [Pullulanibacillus sp. KACC 23026]|uniref:ATP phosphoribosyltransferase n=1 Tax=Pullulanibacillus sp. KACC 23026 TaxID=3028315 RepID=UPI0023AF4689|nr:ATP phosphoribosyltransferase [Pullulanibacillus sp. KACC 23026]WEG13615.1 ATP phosphoribosyltransferase [Pullulanibacillus sp. KACC 23026]
MEPITIAMPKGRILEDAIALLNRANIPCPDLVESSRKLIFETDDHTLRFILAKPTDVPTYVEYGVADLGIAGKDVLLEEQRDVYELLDLNISPCRMSVAGRIDQSTAFSPRIATKYPRIASTYFRQQGEQVEIIPLNGSIELAPIIGLADRIVDIVSTGTTLKENGLVEKATIASITSRLIANPTSYRLKKRQVVKLFEQLKSVIGGQGIWNGDPVKTSTF